MYIYIYVCIYIYMYVYIYISPIKTIEFTKFCVIMARHHRRWSPLAARLHDSWCCEVSGWFSNSFPDTLLNHSDVFWTEWLQDFHRASRHHHLWSDSLLRCLLSFVARKVVWKSSRAWHQNLTGAMADQVSLIQSSGAMALWKVFCSLVESCLLRIQKSLTDRVFPGSTLQQMCCISARFTFDHLPPIAIIWQKTYRVNTQIYILP